MEFIITDDGRVIRKMLITITTKGVIFNLREKDDAANKAVQMSLRIADLCGWKVRGMAEVAEDRWMVQISGTHGAARNRQMFAERLVFELDKRGVAAEVVA